MEFFLGKKAFSGVAALVKKLITWVVKATFGGSLRRSLKKLPSRSYLFRGLPYWNGTRKISKFSVGVH
jgi:hypothetical protein